MPKELSPHQREEFIGLESNQIKLGQDKKHRAEQELMGTVYAEWMSKTGVTQADVNSEKTGQKIQ